MFLPDVACQKLLKSANVSRFIQKISGTVFLRHGEHYINPRLLTSILILHHYQRPTGLCSESDDARPGQLIIQKN